MQVFFRVDSSTEIGSGHVHRCLSLAKHMPLDWEICFISRNLNGNIINLVKKSGYRVIVLPDGKNLSEYKSNNEYLKWLTVSIQDDLDDIFQYVKNADIFFIDHYSLDSFWEKTIKEKYKCLTVAIDDIGRKHDVDILIDQTYKQKEDFYSNSSFSKLLLGSKYALLNKTFTQVKKCLLDRDPKILLSFGGIDKTGLTLKVLESYLKTCLEWPITVLLNKNSKYFDKLMS